MRHSEGPRFHRRAEESGLEFRHCARDPSLRLRSGSAQDDASSSWLSTAQRRMNAAFRTPRFHQRAEESGVERIRTARDPSLRLNGGSAQDDVPN